jgi:hypothetical protein
MKTIGRSAGLIILALTLAIPALAVPALAGACDHDYLLGQEHSKTYTVKNKATGASEQYTVSVEKLTANSFDLHYRFPQTDFVLPFTCTPAGLTTPDLRVGPQKGGASYHITSSSGVVIAAPDRWKVGGTWTYTNQGTTTTSNGQTYPLKNEMTFQITARERVTVPAGSYDAFKVVLTQKIEAGGGVINYTVNQWYARGMGVVRQEDQTNVHELVSYKR